MKDNIIYLSGPMSGYPKLNFPLFDHYQAKLEDAGFAVISPARLDSDDFRAQVLRGEHDDEHRGYGQAWIDSIVRDLDALCEADAVAVLPDWHKSLGARIEVTTAMRYQQPIYKVSELCQSITPYTHEFLRGILNGV